MAMLALKNYIDDASVTITASPTALGGLPTSNLKIPWHDGIARGSSATRTFSLSWELPTTGSTLDRKVDIVALLGVNWRSTFLAEVRWWNSGGSWSSPLGSTYEYHYYSGSYAPWIGPVPRNCYVPLLTPAAARYWRLDVTISMDLDGVAWPWEARRLWVGPALRFNMRAEPRTVWTGTQASDTGFTAIPNVSRGQTFRRIAFAGRAIPFAEVYGPAGGEGYGLHSLDQLIFDKGLDAEAILLTRDVSNLIPPNHVQTLGCYGKLADRLETILKRGNRIDLSGEIQEVPSPLPSSLVP